MSSKQNKKTARGFTLIELLVSITIIGILVSLGLAAVMRSRETARNTQCKSKLRQLGLALQDHNTKFGKLPKDGDNGWGYSVFLLPGLEQSALSDKISPLTSPLTSTTMANAGTTDTILPIFQCPSFDGSPQLSNKFARSSYVGNEDIFKYKFDLVDVYDGESNTIMVGETVNDHAWALPGTGSYSSSPNGGGSYGSQHAGGANFVMCDSSVKFISESIDQGTFQALGTTEGREVIGEF